MKATQGGIEGFSKMGSSKEENKNDSRMQDSISRDSFEYPHRQPQAESSQQESSTRSEVNDLSVASEASGRDQVRQSASKGDRGQSHEEGSGGLAGMPGLNLGSAGRDGRQDNAFAAKSGRAGDPLRGFGDGAGANKQSGRPWTAR